MRKPFRVGSNFPQLQPLQEAKQGVRRTIAAHASLRFIESSKRLLLHRKIGLDVAMSGVGAFVPEPQRDHVEGDS